MTRWIPTILILLLVSTPVYSSNATSLGEDGVKDAVLALASKDYKTALEKLTPLAESGSAEAQYLLSSMYKTGTGVAQDFRETVKWLKLSSEKGYNPSQYTLGKMYGKGQGVTLDFIQAYKWLYLAGTDGYFSILDGINKPYIAMGAIEKQMTPTQIAEAQKLAKEWIETQQKKELIVGSKCSTFLWSSNPGAYEMQLQRRCNSPYFPVSQKAVSEEELFEAKRIDNDDYALAEQRLLDIGNKLEELGSTTTSGSLIKIRENLEGVIKFSMGVGGRAYETASAAHKLREAVILSLRQTFSSDEDTLAIIEKADVLYKKNNRIFHVPIVAQLTRERSPIKETDTITSILSEDAQTISIVMNIFKGKSRLLIIHSTFNIAKRIGFKIRRPGI